MPITLGIYREIVEDWLAPALFWLANWTVEGAGTDQEGYWSVYGVILLPFAPVDADLICREVNARGINRQLHRAWRRKRELDFQDASTQVAERRPMTL